MTVGVRNVVGRRNEIDFAVQEFASAGGDPVLLIHGIDADMSFWRAEFCELLMTNGFGVARFDNRDCGSSTHLGHLGAPNVRRVRCGDQVAPYLLEDMADDAVAVLDALGWPSAHVVGHSLGGMIAQLFAVRHPGRTLSLTSISSSTSAAIGRAKPRTILRLLRANPAEFLGRPARSPAEAAARLIRGHRVIGSPHYPPDEVWLTTVARERYGRKNDPAARARQEAAGWASGDIQSAIGGIRVPSLVIHGGDDRFVRPEGGIVTAAAIPDSKLVVFPGMGHDLPRELWPTIVGLIKGNAADRGIGRAGP